MPDDPDGAPRETRELVGFVLFGSAVAWNVGSVGPVATALGAEFDVSLGAIGVLTGTAFFVGVVVAKLAAAGLIDRIGTGPAARITCLAAVIGNLIVAASPIAGAVGVGRLLCGVGLGLALVLGPVLSRSAGGPRWVGFFGASVTFGTAGALGIGSLMRAAGVDWRVDFVLAAIVAIVALVALPAGLQAAISSGSILALIRQKDGRLRAARLELLFVATLGVPFVVGVWLVPYLTEDVGLGSALAGLSAAAMYVLMGTLRPEGARLEARRVPLVVLGGLAPLVAAVGLGLVSVASLPALVLLGVLVAAVGFAIPYAAMFDEAHLLFPGSGVAAVGLLSVGANLVPAVLMPPIGAAIDSGHGETGILALAVLSLAAGVANLGPVAAPD